MIDSTHKDEFLKHKDEIIERILLSRYLNLYKLLLEQLDESTYIGIVKNKILVDVQGDDLLFQIFTSNILQRESSDEAPFFEFIQRVCSQSISAGSCENITIKPGCGGFGIRNFLTLFLSIEVSKAMREANSARDRGDNDAMRRAQKAVEIFTEQLDESNPILTEISDAMTLEGHLKDQR